jgi:hypothetical protein
MVRAPSPVGHARLGRTTFTGKNKDLSQVAQVCSNTIIGRLPDFSPERAAINFAFETADTRPVAVDLAPRLLPHFAH